MASIKKSSASPLGSAAANDFLAFGKRAKELQASLKQMPTSSITTTFGKVSVKAEEKNSLFSSFLDVSGKTALVAAAALSVGVIGVQLTSLLVALLLVGFFIRKHGVTSPKEVSEVIQNAIPSAPETPELRFSKNLEELGFLRTFDFKADRKNVFSAVAPNGLTVYKYEENPLKQLYLMEVVGAKRLSTAEANNGLRKKRPNPFLA
ncbi:MAG: hypothetical protein SNF33_07945 [Candidatus Algichlamydia australiensis]|nr:hypothetical protein [Chlamydiales bacterium]